jgi:hypothetical protein
LNLMATASRPAPPPPGADARPDASIGDLFQQLFDDSGRLVRAELRLAQAEFTASFRAMLPSIAAILVGGVFLLGSMLTMLAALVGWLTPYLGAGNAALAVTIGEIVIGGGLIAYGVTQMKTMEFAPRRRKPHSTATDTPPPKPE